MHSILNMNEKGKQGINWKELCYSCLHVHRCLPSLNFFIPVIFHLFSQKYFLFTFLSMIITFLYIWNFKSPTPIACWLEFSLITFLKRYRWQWLNQGFKEAVHLDGIFLDPGNETMIFLTKHMICTQGKDRDNLCIPSIFFMHIATYSCSAVCEMPQWQWLEWRNSRMKGAQVNETEWGKDLISLNFSQANPSMLKPGGF